MISDIYIWILEMIEEDEKILLKREHPPKWLLDSIPSNAHIVPFHGEEGQDVAVPLALLVADSEMAYTLLLICVGPEKHITITAAVEIICEYVKILSTGQMKIAENKR